MRNLLMVAAMAALMATTLSAAEPSENCAVRIECEAFESLGGWVDDTQLSSTAPIRKTRGVIVVFAKRVKVVFAKGAQRVSENAAVWYNRRP